MRDELESVPVRGESDCVFCGRVLAPADCVASIRLLSHARGQQFFGAHVGCLQRAVRPEVAALVDPDDVPPGLDHYLGLPAWSARAAADSP